jgi:hypothetical protein
LIKASVTQVVTAITLDKSFIEWKPEVDSSITAVKLELSKLNSFFDCDIKAPGSSSPGVLNSESAPACPSTGSVVDGPNGHRSANDNRDCGFGHVYTQFHDPVKGTILPPFPKFHSLIESVLGDSARFTNNFGSESRVPLGKLPKINFPEFDGENPKL